MLMYPCGRIVRTVCLAQLASLWCMIACKRELSGSGFQGPRLARDDAQHEGLGRADIQVAQAHGVPDKTGVLVVLTLTLNPTLTLT